MLVRTLMWLLAVVHVVPALDHIPHWVATRAWADAWRGWGALSAVLWFVLPVAAQGRVLGKIRLIGQVRIGRFLFINANSFR
jgi:hypothetical protein